MEKLTAFHKKWSKRFRRVGRGCWLDDVSDIQRSGRTTEIARRAGYSPRPDIEFHRISKAAAARVLAYVQKESLAYGRRRYREGLAKDMFAMLSELEPEAEFWSNTPHEDFEDPLSKEPATSWSWNPISEATFDTGVIAFNATTGFMFWVAEDD